jgi:hypothetical protein
LTVATARAVLFILQQVLDKEKREKWVNLFLAILCACSLLLTFICGTFTVSSDDYKNLPDDEKADLDEVYNDFGFDPSNPYIQDSGAGWDGDWTKYDPLNPEAFTALMDTATPFIGRKYVWGGSTPETGFDCSGFVCWCYTHSGVYDLPRTTAQGIYDEVAHIPPDQAVAGDIVFFTGTYDSAGAVSHVGIYLGNGKMLHCGDPIGYADITTAYWQEHLYGFGRVISAAGEAEEPEDS